jgi:hypothetical protein
MMKRRKLILPILFVVVACALIARSEAFVSFDQWFDSYERTTWGQERLRLDSFAHYLNKDRQSNGYVAIYALPQEKNAAIRRRVDRIRRHLTEKRGVDAKQLVIIVAGRDEKGLTILQPVKQGVARPEFP